MKCVKKSELWEKKMTFVFLFFILGGKSFHNIQFVKMHDIKTIRFGYIDDKYIN